MFHQGDLQSGIATAIQQQKLVTCFVYDDDAESAAWEHEMLPSLGDLISEKTVLLKMRVKSQEAAFLSAFCPMDKAPSLAVVDNGKVVVKLEAPVDPQHWRSQMENALHSRDSVPASATQTAPVQPQSSAVVTEPRTPSTNTTTTQASSNLQILMPGRAARLEADQATKQAAEKAARVARAEAQRKEIEAATAASSANGKQPASSDALPPKVRTDWVREQAKRKDEAKRERERILRQIQSDKEERKLRGAMEKQTLIAAEPMQPTARTASPAGASCALHLRLLDGSSIRKQFSAYQTLNADVRKWVKETAPEEAIGQPYTFRHLLAPRPSRDIETGEESQSLSTLGLLPSATLVLVPSPPNIVSSAEKGFFMRLLSTLLGLLAGFFSLFTGRSGGDAEPTGNGNDASQSTSVRATGVDTSFSARKRTKTLADSRAEENDNDAPAEFYNGNSSAFEGRKDDED